jgi:glycosyltransferase involved in cell wall biosynthesis
MRILIIHSNYGALGGGEVYVNSFIELLKSHGHETFLFSFDKTESTSQDQMIVRDSFDYRNQNPITTLIAYFGRFYFSPYVFIKVHKWVRKIKPDIIHVHANDKFAISVLLALMGNKIPVVQSIHAYTVLCMSESSKIKGRQKCKHSHGISCLTNKCLSFPRFLALVPPYWLKWYLTKKVVDLIITPNKLIEERINLCGYLNTVFLEHFIPDENIKNDAMEEGRILCIGRLIKAKGFQYVIYAFHKINRNFPKARLDICGEGPYQKDLKKIVEDLNLTSTVTFHGAVPYCDLEGYYLRSNVVIFPSTCLEICGLVNLEAMKFRRPLIISNLCGVSELFENYESSFIIDVTDTGLLAEKVEEIISDKRLGDHLGQKARLLYEKQFNSEIHYERLMELYLRLIETSLKSKNPKNI